MKQMKNKKFKKNQELYQILCDHDGYTRYREVLFDSYVGNENVFLEGNRVICKTKEKKDEDVKLIVEEGSLYAEEFEAMKICYDRNDRNFYKMNSLEIDMQHLMEELKDAQEEIDDLQRTKVSKLFVKREKGGII